MPKWLVPLIVVGVACGLLVGVGIRSLDRVEAAPASPTAATAVEAQLTESAPSRPASLEELPLGLFLDRASGALVVRDPETVTSLGIGEALGIGNGELTPLSASYRRETERLQEAILERLRTYDLSIISRNDRLDARIYGWFLENLVRGHPFADHAYTVHPFITSYPDALERFLLAVHPIRSERDAVDYVHRLSQIGERYDELIEELKRSEAIGAVPPRFVLEETLSELRRAAGLAPTASPFYTGFVAKLVGLDLPESRREELASSAVDRIEHVVLPAYERLVAYLEGLVERAPEEGGVWRHVDGDAYYAYLLRAYTTTDLDAEEIHTIGLAEVDRIRAEIDAAAETLGLDPDLSLVDLYAQLAVETGSVSGEETRSLCERLLAEIEERIEPAFLRTPRQGLVVVSGGKDAFYTPGTLDGSRPGLFYAPTDVASPRYEIPTMVYHEGIPGHHFQISTAYETPMAAYRSSLSFTAYAEGWALYAERLVWELGAYGDDPAGDLGRLQAEILRAVRLVVDTGIHATGWTYEEAVDYMIENTGFDEAFVRDEVVRYIVLPGQATAYKIGMLKFLELRARAERALGERFNLAAFHDALLREGSVPLPILEELVDEYIDRTNDGA